VVRFLPSLGVRAVTVLLSLLALLRVGAFVPGASCGGPPRDPSRSLLNPHGSHARLYFMSREKRASRGFLQAIPVDYRVRVNTSRRGTPVFPSIDMHGWMLIMFVYLWLS
jgi:hypothetical protein